MQESAAHQLPVNVVMVIEGEEENDSQGFITAIVPIPSPCCYILNFVSTHCLIHWKEDNLDWFAGTDVLLVSNGLWVGNRRPCAKLLISLNCELDGMG